MALVVVRFLIVVILGYLLGSIPFGLVFARAVGVDVRQMGSGKTGATNVLRSAGPGAGLLAAICDTAKGAAPVLLSQFLIAPSGAVGHEVFRWIAAAGGLAAVLGHTYPLYLGFKGGRGVASTGGMALALSPIAALLVVPIFILPIVLTRYVSLGSMVGATALPFMYLLVEGIGQHGLAHADLAPFVAYLITAAAIDVSHRDNIQRIMDGTERKIGDKARPVVG